MRRPLCLALVSVLCLVLLYPAVSLALSTATQTVTIEVSAINEIAVTGTVTLNVNAATAGDGPDAAQDATSKISYTTNGTNKKITAKIGAALPDGVTLSARIGSSGSFVPLTTGGVDLLTSLTETNSANESLYYLLTATLGAGVVSSTNVTVTFTIEDSGS